MASKPPTRVEDTEPEPKGNEDGAPLSDDAVSARNGGNGTHPHPGRSTLFGMRGASLAPLRAGGRSVSGAAGRLVGSRRRNLYASLVLGVAVAAAAVFGLNAVYGFLNGSSPSSSSQRTTTVARGIVQASVSASGNVGVAKSASADFATSGTLSTVKVTVGEHVKRGQVLATIDPTSAKDTLMSAQANLQQAESALATAKSGLTAAQQASNTESLEQAQATVTTDEQQLASDQTTLAVAKAQLASDEKLSCPAMSSSSANANSSSSAAASTSSSAASNGSTASSSSQTASADNGASSDTGSSATGATATSPSGTGSATGGAGATSSIKNGVAELTTTPAGAATSTTASNGSGSGTSGSVTSSTGTSGEVGSAGSSNAASATSPVVTGQASSVGVTTATLSGSVDPNGTAMTYWFVYGTSATSLSSSTAKLDAGSGSQAVPVSVEVTGVKADTAYDFELVARTASTTTDGALEQFTTMAPDSASTGQASSVGPTTATLSGEVSPDGLATTYFFQYGLSPAALSFRTASFAAGSGTVAVPVSVAVSGLKPHENYLFRLVAVSAAGTSDGTLALFGTSGATQSATTGSASSVDATSAILSGTVSPSGLATSYWFEYGTSATDLSDSTTKIGAGSGTVSLPVTATVSALKPDTSYVFELVAQNASGTSTGTEATFTTTTAALPAVTTGSASGALTSAMTLNGTVNPGGLATSYWFEYGTTSAYGHSTPVTAAGSGTAAGAVTATVSGLKGDTQYLFRLVARNALGTSAGIGVVAKTAESACVTDAQTVTADEQTLAHQQATVTQAKESLAQTEASIASSETPSASTIAQDEATVAQDQATVSADQKALTETTLVAPIAGVVTAVNDSVGQTVGGTGTSITSAAAAAAASSSSSSSSSFTGSSSTGSSGSSTGFITIDSLNQLEIVSGFPEADAVKIAVGQPATITFPALPNVEVAGKVVAVSNTSSVVSNVVTYNETIALINPPSTVKEGMTADVSVVDQTANNVLYLASSAITTTGTVSTVELLQNGKTTVTPVVTGLIGNSSTQIVSGVKLGDVVVEPTVSIAAASSTASTSSSSSFAGLGGAGLGGGTSFTRGG